MEKTAKLLVVDDEPVIQLLLEEVLGQDGHEIRVAADGGAASRALDEVGEFDAALVDKNLPDRSGLEVIRELKARQPDMEVIMITGYPSLDSAIEAMRVGAFDYLLKPFGDINDLRVKVRNACEKRWLRQTRGELTRELSASEDRYQKLFGASSDAIIAYDAATGRIREANPAAQALYGYSADEFRERHAADLAPKDRRRPAEPPRSKPLAGVIRRRDLTRDGRTITVEVSAAAVGGAGDTIVEVVRDVTDRLRAEEEKRILEQQLVQAQKMEAIGRLAGGVAHDFNNLLVVVQASAQFIKSAAARSSDTALVDAIARYADSILDAGQSASALTRQLLAFSRRQVVSPEVLDVNGALRHLERLLRRAVGEQIEVVQTLDQDLPPVKIDRTHLEQLVVNLAVNARDAMPSGGTLTIATAAVDLGAGEVPGLPPGSYVHLSVTDTGTGMTEEVRRHALEPFFTTKEGSGGTGLGLATVHSIAEQAGGAVALTSAPGQGTTVSLYLPTSREAPKRPSGHPPERDLRGRGETLLLVEDDDAVRTVMRQILDDAGYTVIEARGGDGGILAFQRHRDQIALVITDVVMPGISGKQLVDRLHELRPELRALYTSGYAADIVVHHGVDGGDGGDATFLPKPFTERALLACVRDVLDA